MSVSLYAYEPWKCDGEFCAGDCDLCDRAELPEEDIITPERYLKNDN